MSTARKDPWLLTPGPLTTSLTVKQATLRDWGSRDGEFIDMNRRIRTRLLDLAGASDTHVCVCLQGSGTFAVEAAIGTLVPRDGKLLVVVNGAYGERMVKIAKVLRRSHAVLETGEDQPPDPAAVGDLLARDPAITDVAVVHCETTSGILNPLAAVAEVVSQHGRRLIVDAMSSFGAIDVDARKVPFDALVASSNKCLEGLPGMGFVLARQSVLAQRDGNAHSLSLDLCDQWRAMEANGQWRFTPPTHVIAAFEQALREHEEEGGVAGRGARYRRNCQVLVGGMRELGFETYLPDAVQAPIIVTFRTPADPRWNFSQFYDYLRERDYAIYPGKLTKASSFRIGCIGRLGEPEMRGALAVIAGAVDALGVTQRGPGGD